MIEVADKVAVSTISCFEVAWYCVEGVQYAGEVLQWYMDIDRAQLVVIVRGGSEMEELLQRITFDPAVLRGKPILPRVSRLALLEDVLKHHGRELADGAIVVASSRKIRVRRPS